MKINTIILCTIFLIYSCKKENQEDTQNTIIFPLELGNSWTYKVTHSFTNCTDTNGNSLNDTTLQYVLFTEFDTILTIDSIITNALQSCCSFSNRTSCSYSYPHNDSEGLKISNPGYQFGYAWLLFFPTFESNYYFGDISRSLNKKVFTNANDDRDLILKYPLEVGNKWDIKLHNENILTKEVINFENINISEKDYKCFKIKYTYSNNPTVEIYDYISSIGLVKRETFRKNVSIINSLYQLIGYADLYENRELTDYNIED